jgi:hypothetical protein
MGGALLLAACSSERATSPTPDFSQNPAPGAQACNQEATDALITAVFGNTDNGNAAHSRFAELVKAAGKGGNPTNVRSKALNLVDFIIRKYQAGLLIGGTSQATAQKVADLLTGVLCLAGLPPFNPAALGLDGAAVVVLPNSPTTDVVTGTGFAGMEVQTGSVNEPTLLTIFRLPDSPGPLLTQFDQYPAFYEFSYNPAAPFNIPVVVATCLSTNFAPPDPSRLRLAHNVAPYTMGSIEILTPVPAPFVDCTNAAAMPSARPQDLAHQSFNLLKNALATVVLPPRLEAMRYFGQSGLSGSVRTFSPFGGVDPLGIAEPTIDFLRSPPLGELVEAATAVRLTTPTGHLMQGFTVNWAVTAGGGSIGDASSVSDINGIATQSFWRFGFTNPQSVTATVVAPANTSFQGSPVVFQGVGR